MGRVSAVVIAVLGLGLLPASAAGAGFSLGVTASEVTSSTAIVWAHATSTGTVGVQVARDKSFHRVVATGSVKAKSSNDNTVQVLVRKGRRAMKRAALAQSFGADIAADTTYFYRRLDP